MWGIISVRSGDGHGQVFGSGRKAGQVELGDFAAPAVRVSAGLAYGLLLRKVIGC